jgi:hypothetical protein
LRVPAAEMTSAGIRKSPRATLRSVIRSSGVSVEEFVELLD